MRNATPWRNAWRHDLPASLVVFMVALPLSIAIAQASGLPAEAGIITGIIGGLVVGPMAGSPLQVSGPAAGLIVVVLAIVQRHGLAGMGAALFLGGCLQIAAGCLRLGQWFRAVSPAVIHGMLAGIGLVIVAKQAHVLVDDHPGDASVVQTLLSIPHALSKAFTDGDADPPHHQAAAAVGLLAIGLLVTWRHIAPRRLAFLPPALVAVAVAAIVGQCLDREIKTVVLGSDLSTAIRWLPATNLGLLLSPEIWQSAVPIFLIASAETLLCAAAVDRLHSGPRTRYSQELAVQGIGNLVCGFLGVLPMTGVIVRSAANVEAGAKTRLSAILHGVWMLVFVCLCPGVLRLVPLTSLAAILIVTGYKLINPASIRDLWRASRSEVVILVVTAGTIVTTDLLVGVVTGVALAVIKIAWTISHLRVQLETDLHGGRARLRLDGAATFLRLPLLADTMDLVPPHTELHVDFEHLTYVDHACLELLVNWEKRHAALGGRLVIDWDSLHARFHSPRRGVHRAVKQLPPALADDAPTWVH